MIQITLKVEGMKCGMCESHINDTVRKTADIKKVASSHLKKQTVILSEHEIDEEQIKSAIEQQGYRVLSVNKQPYEKKGLFSFLKK